MATPTITFLGVTQAGKDGLREWRYVVNGINRVFYTVKAPNADEAIIALRSKLNGNAPTALPTRLLGDNDNDDGNGDSTASNVVAIGLIGAAAYGVYKLVQWWRRNEDGPTGGWGFGFGKGNGVSLNPLDKGKAGTGDGGESPGAQWERATVSGVKGWRRKGIPLPGEEGNPNTFQAAALVVSEDGTVPDLAGWPKNLPVFFVDDPEEEFPTVEGGWLVDAHFGTTELQRTYPSQIHNFSCAATDSASLAMCVKQELEDSLSIQWA
jgi:hypothetical protein